MKQGAITVLSCGLGKQDDVISFQSVIDKADVLAGSQRLVTLFQHFGGEVVSLDKEIRCRCEKLLERAKKGKNVVILASGDSLYNGVGAIIGALADDMEITYLPGPTAFQELFSRLGMSWKNVRFFSVHSRPVLPAREIMSVDVSVTYGGTTLPATTIAEKLLEFLPSAKHREAVLAEKLGMEGERIFRGTLEEISVLDGEALSMLLILPAGKEEEMAGLALGLEDDVFEHENGLITSQEVRAIALSKLRLPPKGVLWDLGAGSGSVGLEAAALQPGLSICAVEKSLGRVESIKKNARILGVVNHRAIHGNAVEELSMLPKPNRIFIGGGGKDITTLMEKGFDALEIGGVMVVSALLIETLNAVLQWHPEFRTDVCSIDIASEKPLAGKYHYLKNQNRITLISFRKP